MLAPFGFTRVEPPVVYIDNCDSATGWTAASLDTSLKSQGTGSLKVTSTGGIVNAYKPTALDLRNGWISLDYRIDNKANLTAISFFLDASGTALTKYAQIPSGLPIAEEGVWVTRRIHVSDLSYAGGCTEADLANVGSIRVRVFGVSSTTVNVNVDNIRFWPASNQGAVSFRFDDGLSSHKTLVAPALEALGVRGAFYVHTSTIGTANRMTSADLVALDAAGHDVCSHGYSEVDVTSLNTAQLLDHLQRAKDDLAAWGIDARHYAFPFGKYFSSQLPAVLGIYDTARSTTDASTTTYGQSHVGMHHPTPLLDGLTTGRIVVAADSQATINGLIAEARRRGTHLSLIFHEVVSSGATASQVNLSTIQAAVQYAQAQGVRVLNVSDAYLDSFVTGGLTLADIDTLTSSVNTRLATSSYTAPDNEGIAEAAAAASLAAAATDTLEASATALAAAVAAVPTTGDIAAAVVPGIAAVTTTSPAGGQLHIVRGTDFSPEFDFGRTLTAAACVWTLTPMGATTPTVTKSATVTGESWQPSLTDAETTALGDLYDYRVSVTEGSSTTVTHEGLVIVTS